MDLLNGRIRPLYFKYLSAAFGSALISSIYGMVDMAMVGQYQGLCVVVPAAAFQHIFHLLFSVHHAALGGVYRLRGAGTGHQRRADPAAAAAGRAGLPVVCHAGDGAADGGLYRVGYPEIYKAPVR